MTYVSNLIVMFSLYALLGLSLNFVVGHAGLISAAHAAFYGLGAYFTSLLLMHGFSSPLAALAVGAVGAGVVGAMIGYFSISLKGDSFVIGTLALQMLIVSLFRNLKGVTGGPYGLTVTIRPAAFSDVLHSEPAFLAWAGIPILLVAALIVVLYSTPFARVLKAVRDNVGIADALGKSLGQLRTQNMAISSLIAGFAGGLFALYSSYIDPSSFTLDVSIFILMIVIIGGSGNLKGPIAGAALLLLVPELLRFVPLSMHSVPYIRQMLYGLILIVVMRLRPQGLFGNYRFNQ
jgi:branched-chain amino acid transport system permease protein